MAFIILLGSVGLSAFCSDHFEVNKTDAIFDVTVSCVDQLCDFVLDSCHFGHHGYVE
jgi:hypothetical protein